MNILIISRCAPWPLHLGDRLILYHLIFELEARKHSIDLLAFTDNRAADEAQVSHYDAYIDHLEFIDEPKRAPTDYLLRLANRKPRFPDSADDSWSPAMWRAIERQLAEKHYDAIQLFGGIQVYEFAGALAGRPAIITPYESFSLYLRRAFQHRFNPLTWARWQVARGFERWMFTPYAQTVVVAEPDRHELHDLNPALPLTVIPNGIDEYEFKPRPTPRENVVLLFTGNYEYLPNVDAALKLAHEIFPQVREVHPEARLWLVGNAPPPELQALNSEAIHVTGRVPDVKPYLARATVFVCPLRLGAGIKNKVLEAMAMGCPVVATPLSLDGIEARPGEDVLSVPYNQLTGTVLRLLNDAALRERLSANGAALVRDRYTWARVAEAYEGLYEGLGNTP